MFAIRHRIHKRFRRLLRLPELPDQDLTLLPFGNWDRLSARHRRAMRRQLARAGIRMMPHPFATIAGIVSDIDAAMRDDVEAYVGLLIEHLGLDFGDSCRLHQRSIGTRGSEALTFFACNGALVSPEMSRALVDDSLTHLEILRAVHLGHVDHFHGLSGLGTRVLWLHETTRDADGVTVVATRPEIERTQRQGFNFRADLMPLARVAVVSAAPLDDATVVTVETTDGVVRTHRIADAPPDTGGINVAGRLVTWFEVGDFDTTEPHLVRTIERITVTPVAPDTVVHDLAVTNMTRPHLRRMLDDLATDGRFATALFTDHSSRVFISLSSESRHGRASASRLRTLPASALYSRVSDPDHGYSVLGDDPASASYVLDLLRDEHGVRFINPGGNSGEPADGFDPLNTVLPTMTRDGSRVYFARRTSVTLPDDASALPDKYRNDQGTRAFPHRLQRMLDVAATRPGHIWPIYTHLGNIKPKTDRADPYFDLAPLHELQDRLLNISGDVAPDRRTWFTRGTLLYDYALMLRGVGPHVTREPDDIIRIASWHDGVLDRRLPVSPEQLHGLTFYVGDADRAEVWLDDTRIETLTRNPADATGRASITIVGARIRHIVLDDVDLVTEHDPETDGVEFEWHDDDPAKAARGHAYASLRLTGDGTGSISWTPADLHPAGTQYLAYAARATNGTPRVTVVIETDGDGRFVFGDDGVVDDAVTARSTPTTALTDEWCLRVLPFHDLRWCDDAAPGGPLPSHRVTRVTLAVAGAPGDTIAIDRLEFLRPSACAPTHDAERVLVGGQVVGLDGAATARIRIRHADGTETEHEHDITDPRGLFACGRATIGAVCAVEIRTADGRTLLPTRGRLFDVWGNDLTLVVNAGG